MVATNNLANQILVKERERGLAALGSWHRAEVTHIYYTHTSLHTDVPNTHEWKSTKTHVRAHVPCWYVCIRKQTMTHKHTQTHGVTQTSSDSLSPLAGSGRTEGPQAMVMLLEWKKKADNAHPPTLPFSKPLLTSFFLLSHPFFLNHSCVSTLNMFMHGC